MALANCPRCKKLFNKLRTPVCAACEVDDEADLAKIRETLREHPNRTAEEVSQETGVDLDCVLRLLDEGRIASADLARSVTCGRCGAPAISFSKRLCERCLNQLSLDLAAEQSKIVLPPKRTMGPGTPKSVHETVDDKRL